VVQPGKGGTVLVECSVETPELLLAVAGSFSAAVWLPMERGGGFLQASQSSYAAHMLLNHP
jgi:hypothetical protein